MERPYTAQDRENLLSLYEGRLAKFGHDARTVGWGSSADQWLRFTMLIRGLDLNGKRILDVGCGLGDFVGFLEDQGFRDYEYVGIDLVPQLLDRARAAFGDSRRTFIVSDLLDDPDLGSFDVVISSGALSFRVRDNIGLAERMVTAMFTRARSTLAVNFLSSYVDYQLPKNFHYAPEAMFYFAASLTRFVSLHHDYRLYEYTLQLFREAQSER